MRTDVGSTNAFHSKLYSQEAERATLGALLLDNNVYDLVADIVWPEDFHDTRHQRIYQAIQRQVQHGEPFDPVTLSDRLNAELPLLAELARETPSTANAAAYASMVHNAAIRRQVIAIADQLRKQASGSDSTTEALIDDASRPVTRRSASQVSSWVRESLALPSSQRNWAGTAPSRVVVSTKSSCLRSGRWSLE